jgi:aspartate/methionine/tyrosine aminotransferase
MKSKYLTWFKDLEIELESRDEGTMLLCSSIQEPLDLLHKLITPLFEQNLSDHFTRVNGWGLPSLIENLAKRYFVKPENVQLSNGASNAIFLVCQSLLSKGDHVIVESPVYEPLIQVPEFARAKITRLLRRPEEFRIDLKKLQKAITSKTKMIILTNLHNPSGAYLDDSLLADLLSAVKKDIHIVIDEIYHDFIYSIQKPAAALDKRFISINSLSKVYGMSLLRCGWILADAKVIKQIRKLHSLVENIGSKILEKMSSVVIENMDEFLNRSIHQANRNRKILEQGISPLLDKGILSGKIPEYGCIYYPKIEGVDKPEHVIQDLLDLHKIFVVPGHFFGDADRIRIGFGGKSADLRKNLRKFSEGFLAAYENYV